MIKKFSNQPSSYQINKNVIRSLFRDSWKKFQKLSAELILYTIGVTSFLWFTQIWSFTNDLIIK